MRKCWLPNAKDRPTFSKLAREIKDMITMLEHAMKQGEDKADIQTTYVNMDNCTDYHYTDELMAPPDSDDESSVPTSPTSPTSPKSPTSPTQSASPKSVIAESEKEETGTVTVPKILKKFDCKIVNIFLPISFIISFGCSKEPSH